jgi:hypothetical protein
MLEKILAAITLAWLLGAPTVNANAAFDHTHAAWNELLKKHVVPISEGNASQVNYAGLAADRAQLQAYLASVAGVSRSEYDGFSSPQKLAFLINAYNAYTVEFILTRYPDLKSIKDLGSLLTSPWKKKFPRLFGEEKTLDAIEHGLIRAPGTFDEPRIHMAVVCASIGCPALRNEAFVAEKIDAQLEDGVKRFLSDHSRNRYNKSIKALEVSKIFDWYGKDFAAKSGSVAGFLARYAQQLGMDADAEQLLRDNKLKLVFLDYDWSLNDVRK